VEPRRNVVPLAPPAASRDWPKLPIVEPPAPPIGARPLFEGCHGPDVEALQRKLGLAPTDGWFGRQTFRAVADWQAAHGLGAGGTSVDLGPLWSDVALPLLIAIVPACATYVSWRVGQWLHVGNTDTLRSCLETAMTMSLQLAQAKLPPGTPITLDVSNALAAQ